MFAKYLKEAMKHLNRGRKNMTLNRKSPTTTELFLSSGNKKIESNTATTFKKFYINFIYKLTVIA